MFVAFMVLKGVCVCLYCFLRCGVDALLIAAPLLVKYSGPLFLLTLSRFSYVNYLNESAVHMNLIICVLLLLYVMRFLALWHITVDC